MKFNSQICTTKEQSERLLDLRLKTETADMHIFDNEMYIPAWSLHRLLCLLPAEYFQIVMQDFIFRPKEMYDKVINCIEILIKESYFNKEYLEG